MNLMSSWNYRAGWSTAGAGWRRDRKDHRSLKRQTGASSYGTWTFSECHGKPLEDFKEGSDRAWFTFLKDTSGCWVESRLWRGHVGIRSPNERPLQKSWQKGSGALDEGGDSRGGDMLTSYPMRYSLTPFFFNPSQPIFQQSLLSLSSEHLRNPTTSHDARHLHPLDHPSDLAPTASSSHLHPSLRDPVKLTSGPKAPHLSKSKANVTMAASSPPRSSASLTFYLHTLFLSTLLTQLQSHWPLCSSSKQSDTQPTQVLCMECSLCIEWTFHRHWCVSLPYVFQSLLQCHLLSVAFLAVVATLRTMPRPQTSWFFFLLLHCLLQSTPQHQLYGIFILFPLGLPSHQIMGFIRKEIFVSLFSSLI